MTLTAPRLCLLNFRAFSHLEANVGYHTLEVSMWDVYEGRFAPKEDQSGRLEDKSDDTIWINGRYILNTSNHTPNCYSTQWGWDYRDLRATTIKTYADDICSNKKRWLFEKYHPIHIVSS